MYWPLTITDDNIKSQHTILQHVNQKTKTIGSPSSVPHWQLSPWKHDILTVLVMEDDCPELSITSGIVFFAKVRIIYFII